MTTIYSAHETVGFCVVEYCYEWDLVFVCH